MYVDIATELMHQELKTIFGGLVKNLRFEHADASGYWFTFELVNDDRRQTWCIRLEEVKKDVEHTRKKITRCGEYKKPVSRKRSRR